MDWVSKWLEKLPIRWVILQKPPNRAHSLPKFAKNRHILVQRCDNNVAQIRQLVALVHQISPYHQFRATLCRNRRTRAEKRSQLGCRYKSATTKKPAKKTLTDSSVKMVRAKGLEPSWGCPHTDLNRTRLPIPPRPQMLRKNTKSVVYLIVLTLTKQVLLFTCAYFLALTHVRACLA